MIRQAENLREEKSHSVSLSADMYRRFRAFQCNLLLEGFYTRLNYVFVLQEIGKDEEHNAVIKERRNGQGAEVAGVTVEGKVAYLSLVQLQAGVTWQKSHYTRPEKWSKSRRGTYGRRDTRIFEYAEASLFVPHP